MSAALGHRRRRAGGLGQEHAGAPARPSISASPSSTPGCSIAPWRGRCSTRAAIQPTRRRPWPRRGALAPEDVEPGRLRGEGVGQAASIVAAVPGRARGAAAVPAPLRRRGGRGAVLAGRDIGTVICPDATFKLFVTASDAERARRRFEELRARGDAPIYAAVLEELQERDRRDADRAVAPMRIAPDAWVLDTTALDAQAAFAAARDHIEAGLATAGRRRRLNQTFACATPTPAQRPGGARRPARRHPSGAGMQEATQAIEPRPSLDDFAAMLDETLGTSNRLEGSVVRGHRRRHRRRHRHRRRRPQVGRPRRRSRSSARPGQPPEVRVGDTVEVFVERFENTRWRGRPQPREGPARGELEPARARLHRHRARSRATSSAGSRAASPSTSAVPWPSCRAARSTSARCATSAR